MKNYLFRFLTLGVFVVTCSTAMAQTEVWIFTGALIEQKVDGCSNKPYTDHENFWLPKNESYQNLLKSQKESIKNKYPNRYVLYTQFSIIPGKPRVIALVEKKWKCGAGSLTFYEGLNEAEIIQKVEKDKKLYVNIVSYHIVSTINTDEELAKMKHH